MTEQVSIKIPWLQRYRWLFLAHLLACLCLLPQCQMSDTQSPREEKFVTVRLHDSLKRYDSVEIVILAGGDSNQVVGKVWNGALTDPAKLPSFRLAEGENRDLSVRVRGFDSTGALTLNLLISKQAGGQVVADLPVPPTVVIISPKDTTKPVIPPDTIKPPVIIPPKDTVKPPVIIPPDTDDALPPRLLDLSVFPSAVNPSFDSARFDYRVDVAYAESSITFTTRPARKASVVIASDTLPVAKPSHPYSLEVGENDFTVRVLWHKLETVYNVKVWRTAAPVDTTRNPDDPYKDWQHRGTVFINLKTMGMNRTWMETNFPLLLRLTKSNFDFTQAAADGSDLRFSKPNGTGIDYEISRWEPEKNRAEIWIRADSLRTVDDSAKFIMYWGNGSAAAASEGNKVFRTDDGHTAVYHLTEQGSGQDNEYKDASGRFPGRGGPGNGKNVPKRVDGVVGYAQDFHPTVDGLSVPVVGQILGTDYQAIIHLPDQLDPGPQTWTFQAWVKRVGNTRGLIFKKSDRWVGADQRFEILVEAGGGQMAVIREGADKMSNTYVPQQQFVHLDLVYTGTKYDIYIDGFLRESVNWTQGGWPAADCILGAVKGDGSQDGFDGWMDEVWIASQPRSPMWIRMSFETQRPGSTIVTLRR